MLAQLRSSLTYSNVMATIAVFVALGGTSYAVATGSIDSREIKDNSVRSNDLRNNNVRGTDIRRGTVKSSDVGGNALTGADVDESSLGTVPRASTADSSANADFAGNAGALDGIDSTGFLRRVTYRRVEDGPIPDNNFGARGARCQPGEQLIGGGAGFVPTGNFYGAFADIATSAPGISTDPADESARTIAEGETPNVWFGAGVNTDASPSNLVVYAVCAS